MTKIYLLLFPLLIIGCASLQEPVDNALLTEMTQQEKDSISAINNSIIAKKAEKDSAEKQLSVSEQAILVSSTRITLIAAQRDYYLKKEKWCVLSEDNTKLQATRLMIAKTQDISLQELAHSGYCTAKRDSDLAAFRVKEGELAVLVAKLDLEKSKIARGYQSRRYGEEYDKLVDTNKFEIYYNTMQDDLNKRKQEYQKTLDALKIATDKLKALGYEEQK